MQVTVDSLNAVRGQRCGRTSSQRGARGKRLRALTCATILFGAAAYIHSLPEDGWEDVSSADRRAAVSADPRIEDVAKAAWVERVLVFQSADIAIADVVLTVNGVALIPESPHGTYFRWRDSEVWYYKVGVTTDPTAVAMVSVWIPSEGIQNAIEVPPRQTWETRNLRGARWGMRIWLERAPDGSVTVSVLGP